MGEKCDKKPKYPVWFQYWLDHDFWHHQQYVKWSLRIGVTVLVAIIVKFFTG